MGFDNIYASPAFKKTLSGTPTAVINIVDFREFRNPVPDKISLYAARDHFFGHNINSPATYAVESVKDNTTTYRNGRIMVPAIIIRINHKML